MTPTTAFTAPTTVFTTPTAVFTTQTAVFTTPTTMFTTPTTLFKQPWTRPVGLSSTAVFKPEFRAPVTSPKSTIHAEISSTTPVPDSELPIKSFWAFWHNVTSSLNEIEEGVAKMRTGLALLSEG
jgi:hypothetical protein